MTIKSEKRLIINFLRIGDLLQTRWLINLIRADSKHQYYLFCRKQFANTILEELEETFSGIFLLDDTKGSGPDYDSVISKINQENFDGVYNFSFCHLSTKLTPRIMANNYSGMKQSSQEKVEISDPWSQYLFSTVMTGQYNPFHLFQIYTEILNEDYKNISIELENRDAQKTIISTDMPIICIHPFASLDKKRLPMSKWAPIIYRLQEELEAKIYILGSPEEREEVDFLWHQTAFPLKSNKVHNMAGAYNLKEIKELLFTASLFIGHDSSLGHLSAEVSCPSVILGLGTTRQQETIPFSTKSFYLRPSSKCYPCNVQDACLDFKCHREFSIDGLIEAAQALLSGKTPKGLSTLLYQKDVGLLSSHVLGTKVVSTTDLILTLNNILWLYFLKGHELEIVHPNISNLDPQDVDRIAEGLSKAYELMGFGKKFSNELLLGPSENSNTKEFIDSIMVKMDQIEQLSFKLSRSYPEIGPLLLFLTTRLRNVPGEEVQALAQGYYQEYSMFEQLTSAFYELFQKCLGKNNEEMKNDC